MVCFYIVLFFMTVLESIAGFGATSIGIPFLTLALGTGKSVALMAGSGLVLVLLLTVFQHRNIQFRELFTILAIVLPLMPAGFLLYAKLSSAEWVLRLIMGVVTSFVALRELGRRIILKDQSDPPKWLVYSAFGIGAIVQGMFSMGGALINLYTWTRIKDKSKFRATMASVWLVTNTLSLVYRVFVLKMYTPEIWKAILFALPLIAVAFYFGNQLHKRISNEQFLNFVYSVQLLSGLTSLAGGIILLIRPVAASM